MYRVWCEAALPPSYTHLLDGVAFVVGSGADHPDDPFASVASADAIIAGGRLRYDGAVMDRAPALRVISRSGIGLDNIALADATARGIAICYAPDAPTISTAEHALALLLAVAKDLKRLGRLVEEGIPPGLPLNTRGIELQGLYLGVVGLGRIGGRVATMAQGLGMNVLGFDPWVASQRAVELGIERVSTLEGLLERADAVTLHVPLAPETRHMIDAARLTRMKRGAILINVARGALVDEVALLDALERGHLSGVGLDVFADEPPRPDNPLVCRDDVVATPHIASSTTAGRSRLWTAAITQALQVLRGERPPHLVNPEVWPLAARGGRD